MRTRVEVGSSAGPGICSNWDVSEHQNIKSPLSNHRERPTTRTWRRSEIDGVLISAPNVYSATAVGRNVTLGCQY